MYANQVGVSFGKGMADPFVPALAIHLQATPAQLGWLQAFVNLFPTVMQVPWGKFSDFLGRRIPFLVVGGVLSFAMYFFMLGAMNAGQLIMLVGVQMFVGSMMIPAWSALVGDVTSPRNRGTIMGKFFAVSSVASLVATMLAGALMPEGSGSVLAIYAIPFILAGVSGIAGSLLLVRVKEGKRRMYASPRRIFAFGLRSFVFISDLTENLYFRNLVLLQSAFNFIMSLIWPLLYLTYISVLGASLFEIAVMTVISTGATLFFQTKVGKLLDLIGPMPQILISRFTFISVPIVYALATDVWHIYVLNAALGLATAMSNVAFFAYILDVAPDEKKGEYFAVYNTMIGIVTFVGSIMGGYLGVFFLDFYGQNLVLALGAVYAISAFGRGVCAMWFFKLKDPVTYPHTMRSLIRDWGRRHLKGFGS
jgi:MFS family permease